MWKTTPEENREVIKSALLIPAGQAVFSGAICAAGVGGVSTVIGAPDPLGWALIGGSAVAVLAWFSFRAEWARRVNALAGIAEQIEENRKNEQTVRLEIISENGRAGDYLELPGGWDKLQKLARGIAHGSGLTTREWHGLYRQNEWVELRNELVNRQYAAWKSPHDRRGGVVLTRAGQAAMAYIARLDGRPTPPQAASQWKLIPR